jgi:hypothetical protein
MTAAATLARLLDATEERLHCTELELADARNRILDLEDELADLRAGGTHTFAVCPHSPETK